jgi:DNA-binding NarL/FixJ family response regulator
MEGMSKTASAGVKRVVVVDGHQTFTDLVALALDSLPDLECVGQAHSAAAAHDLVERSIPDVALVDVALGSDDGLALSAELVARHENLLVVALTAQSSRALALRAVRAGVCALLHKEGSLRDVLSTLRSARRGAFVVAPEVLQSLTIRTEDDEVDVVPRATPLSDREIETLALMAEGLDARGAARRLEISVHTYRGHVRRVLTKLDAHSQLEAVAIAKQRGLI